MKFKKNIVILLIFMLTVIPLIGSLGQASAQSFPDLDVTERAMSSTDIIKRVEQLAGLGEITSQAIRPLNLHLVAIGQFEKEDETEKVIQHMNGFKTLLNHQYENELLSEEAYLILQTDADDLIEFSGSLHIVRDGEAQAVVVIPDEEFSEAAYTLVHYVQKSTGVELPVLTDVEFQHEKENVEENIRLYVGMSAPGEAIDIEEELQVMDGDGFLIRTQNNSISIIGPTTLGTTNGVYDFLERFVGVRWLAPGEEWEHVPQLERLFVPNVNIREEPDFPFRSMNLEAERKGQDIDYSETNRIRDEWNLKNRMQNPQQIRLGHNLYSILAPAKYGESNPEFYPNGNPPSSNAGWQPCFTVPGTIHAAVSEILDYFDQNPEETSISLAVNDRGGYCEASRSHPDYPNKTNSIGLVDMSDIYYDWVNQVVEQVLEVYPDKWFGLYAYQEVMDPPSFPVHPRVVPVVTKDRLAWIDDDERESGQQQAEAWNEVANMTGWYEYMYGPTFFVPRVYHHLIAENYRYAKENNVLTHHGDNHPSLGDFPKLWLAAKLQWDVDQDVDALLQDWYEAAVGSDAAPDLAAYEAIWENFWTNRIKDTDWFNLSKNSTYLELFENGYLSIVTDEEIQESRRLLESVVEKAVTPEQQVRAKQLLHQFEFYEASALSYPRGIDRPENEEMALEFLARLADEIDRRASFKQKRQVLYDEYAENPATQYPFPFNHRLIEATWNEWSANEVGYIVDYIWEHEPSGGAVTDRLQQMAEHDSYRVRTYASEALELLLRGNELGENLLMNPGFEELQDGFAISWNRSGEVDISSDARTGDHSIKITDSKLHQNVRQMEGGNFYQFSGWLKCEEPRQVALKVEYFRDTFNAAGYVGGTQYLFDIGDDWAQAKMDVRLPSEANMVQTFLLTERGAGSGTCYFDDASLNKYVSYKIETNLVLNPGFEEGGTVPTGWYIQSTANWEWVQDEVHSGRYAITIYPGLFGNSGINSRERIPVTPGKTYRVSYWAKNTSTDGGLVGIRRDDASGRRIDTIWSDVPRNTDWTEHTFTFEATETYSVWFYLVLGETDGQIWFDDIRLVEVEE